jgi:long-chain acyl-CoA synthetase
MTVSVSNATLCISIGPFIDRRGLFAEFLITELALASHSIPSLTLASASLLSPVLEAHPPTAVIVDGSFLPHALELIYDLNESVHHFVIVVGEVDKTVLSHASDRVKVVRWAEIEAQGKEVTPITSPTPGNHHACAGPITLYLPTLVQARTMSSQSLSTEVSMIRCGLST